MEQPSFVANEESRKEAYLGYKLTIAFELSKEGAFGFPTRPVVCFNCFKDLIKTFVPERLCIVRGTVVKKLFSNMQDVMVIRFYDVRVGVEQLEVKQDRQHARDGEHDLITHL